jgi:hypothetical protein
MKRLYAVGLVALLAASALGAFLWVSYSDVMFSLRHDTDRWAAIVDHEGSQLAVEPLSDEVWEK